MDCMFNQNLLYSYCFLLLLFCLRERVGGYGVFFSFFLLFFALHFVFLLILLFHIFCFCFFCFIWGFFYFLKLCKSCLCSCENVFKLMFPSLITV